MWKTYVASEYLLDDGQVDAIGYCECMLINLPAAGYEALCLTGREGECLVEAECHFDARGREGSVTRQHDAAPAGEWAPNRLKRLTSQDQRMAHRESLEASQICRQAPRESVVSPDHPVGRHRGDERNRQTAIGARMGG